MITRTQRPRRILTSIVLSTVLVGGLASCSSDASIEKFCEEGSALGEGPDVDAGSDPDAVMEATRAVIDDAKKVEAPDEIKDDWKVTLDGFSEYVAAFDGVDLSDQEATLKASETAFAALEGEEFTAATERVSTFVDENCTEESASPTE